MNRIESGERKWWEYQVLHARIVLQILAYLSWSGMHHFTPLILASPSLKSTPIEYRHVNKAYGIALCRIDPSDSI